MGHGHPSSFKPVEYYRFGGKGKKITLSIIGVGLAMLLIGLVLAAGKEYPAIDNGHHAQSSAEVQVLPTGGNTDAHADHGHEHHETASFGGHYNVLKTPTVADRFFTALLTNGYMFTGIALLAIFFIAVHHVANGGWFVMFIRICEAMASWLFIGPAILLLAFFANGSEIYLWLQSHRTDDHLVLELLAEKEAYLNTGFFIARQVLAFIIWIGLFLMLRKNSRQEDIEGGTRLFNKRVTLSAIYIVIFAFTFSMSAWDWIMSIESTWFSTMFGVHVFASSWVSAIAIIILITAFLKEGGYLPHLSPGLTHDLGKYLFGFSIFWTYIWFCQFLLIWYANIPESGVYFYNRLSDYPLSFALLVILNFVIPLLVLMTNESKRHMPTLVTVSIIVLIGHWLDFYQMVTPGVMGPFGEIGFLEFGLFVTFLGAFLFLTGTMLSKAPLIPKKHPYIEESLGHTYDI